MTAKQRALYDWLACDAKIVVTTGRSAEAYRRVELRFTGHAICSHGGLILRPDGRPEPGWGERIVAAVAMHRPTFVELFTAIRSRMARAGVDARIRAIAENDQDLYLSIKHNQEDAGELARLAAGIAEELPTGWRLCRNDNNLAVLPPFLGKELAVAWFLEELTKQDAFAIGFGDSLSDVPFMALCDYALAPSTSQLFSSLLVRAS